MQITARVRRTCYVGQVARVEIAWNSSCREGKGTNCSRKIEFTRVHPRYIYIYIYLQSFFLLFFLIRREIGQIKIRSEVRVALEFTRFLVTRGSNVLTRDRIFFFFFHVNGKFYRNFSHSIFSRKRTVNSREKLLSYFSATWRFSRIVRTSRLFPFMINYASSRD